MSWTHCDTCGQPWQGHMTACAPSVADSNQFRIGPMRLDKWASEVEALRARIAELEARLALAEAAREDVRTLFRALHREPDGMWIFSGSAEVFELDKAMDRLAAWRAQKS